MLPTPAFGPWLKERRQALDLTQTALAEQVVCSTNLIQKIESGLRRPSRQLAEVLAECLGVTPADQAAFVQWARGVSPAPESVLAPDTPPAPAPLPPPGGVPAR